jgi:hypothetical protein
MVEKRCSPPFHRPSFLESIQFVVLFRGDRLILGGHSRTGTQTEKENFFIPSSPPPFLTFSALRLASPVWKQ